MLYIHSFSAVEQNIYRELSLRDPVAQMDIQCIENEHYPHRAHKFSAHKVLIYSFQQLAEYSHLDSFQKECTKIKLLVDHLKEHSFERIVLLSYPGAYASSDNLFLQHKGIIEQLFVGSKIPCTILRVQGIGSAPLQINNFHHLFYDPKLIKYIIPKKSNSIIYSINIKNLAEIIYKATNGDHPGQYDVFDKITSLKSFLQYNAPLIKITPSSIFWLYFESYLGKYIAPTMFELFLRSCVPMYNFRTEREFGIQLNSEMFDRLKPKNKNQVNKGFVFEKKEWLVPVS